MSRDYNNFFRKQPFEFCVTKNDILRVAQRRNPQDTVTSDKTPKRVRSCQTDEN